MKAAFPGVLCLLPVMAVAADARVEFYLQDVVQRKQSLQRCMQMTVPAAAADKECQAARSADRKAHAQEAKATEKRSGTD